LVYYWSMKRNLCPPCPTCGLPLACVKTTRHGTVTRRLRRCANGHHQQFVETACVKPTPQNIDKLLRAFGRD